MTKNLKIAMMAINKWFYFALNYEVIRHEWKGISGRQRSEYMPSFLAEAKWTCSLDHMFSKWVTATQSQKPSAYLMDFYAELDTSNRIVLLEWLMVNYNNEKPII